MLNQVHSVCELHTHVVGYFQCKYQINHHQAVDCHTETCTVALL